MKTPEAAQAGAHAEAYAALASRDAVLSGLISAHGAPDPFGVKRGYVSLGAR